MHGETTSLDYNHFDEVTKKTLHGGQYEEYFYDSIGRLQTLNVRGPSHSAWRSENYTYNAAGEIFQHTVDGVATTYTYNSAGRLQQESAPGYTATYTFDGNGNRLTKTVNGVTESYTYDSGDKLLTAGNKTYTYDEAGRTKTVVGSNGTTFLTYDFESRLTQVSGAPGTHTYTYNGLDTRVSKNVAGQTTSFLRDGAYVTDPVIADSLATYTPGVSERRGGTTRYTHSGLKNTGAQSTSSIVATRVYDAYGMVRSTTGTWSGPFGYAGGYGYQEDETGLRLLGHRYYDASTGRFLTRDPIKDGRNWYSYCDGDPINGVDPTGLAGHHLVPKALYDGKVSAAAQKVFNGATTGAIPGGHGWSTAHAEYNEAVDELFKKYLKEKGIRASDLTESQAKAFVNRVLASKDPRILSFLANIYKTMGRSTPRVMKASARKIARRVGKAIVKKVPIIGWVLIGIDVVTIGPVAAANEALWPVSELWGGG